MSTFVYTSYRLFLCSTQGISFAHTCNQVAFCFPSLAGQTRWKKQSEGCSKASIIYDLIHTIL